jgi:hypothetical protein
VGSNLNGYAITTDANPANGSRTNGVVDRQIVLGGATPTPAATTCNTASAVSKDGTLPNFTIVFNPTAGTTTKSCHGAVTATYLTGCNTTTGNTVPDNNSAGVW